MTVSVALERTQQRGRAHTAMRQSAHSSALETVQTAIAKGEKSAMILDYIKDQLLLTERIAMVLTQSVNQSVKAFASSEMRADFVMSKFQILHVDFDRRKRRADAP